MSRIEQIRQRLAALEPTLVEIEDDSHLHAGHAGAREGGGHYRLHIVSGRFAGVNTVGRQRMVYSALGEMMKREIHALTIRANTPEELQN
jgi:BolA family transcriptional regulator, general stress-responsive regulator